MSLEDIILDMMGEIEKEEVFSSKIKYLLHLYKVSPPLKRYFIWEKLRDMGVRMTVCQMKEYL